MAIKCWRFKSGSQPCGTGAVIFIPGLFISVAISYSMSVLVEVISSMINLLFCHCALFATLMSCFWDLGA